MSDDKPEMVTIEVPISVAEYSANWHENPDISENLRLLTLVCKEALAARKTKYTRWREMLMLPWFDQEQNEHEDEDPTQGLHVSALGHQTPQHFHDSWGTSSQAKLMAAAPQLLEALIENERFYNPHGKERLQTKAIRAALPKDVADEVLGGENE